MTAHSTNTTADEPSTEEDGTTRRSRTNVAQWERAASTVLGGALFLRGLRQRSLGGAISALTGGALCYRGLTGHSHLYRLLDVNTAETDERLEAGPTAHEPSAERSITVGKPAEELDEFWRDPDQLTRLAGEFADVSKTDEDQYRWRVHGPFDRPIEWETELVDDRPGELLRWESLEGAMVPHEATVRFRPAPADRGTEVSLNIRYDPPAGAFGDVAMNRFGAVPSALAGKMLHRFKSLAETGEIPTLEGNPSARGDSKGDLI